VPAHLFLIANAAGFGEINIGLRLAHDLHARGDRVEFLAPGDAGVMLGKTPFRHRPLDAWYWELDRRLPALARQEGFATLVLVDVTSVLMALQSLAIDTAFMERLPLPVVALDFWDLRRAGTEWDVGSERMPVPAEASRLARRIVPAPLARPGTPGAFDALPVAVADSRARARERDALGLTDRDRLLLFTSSRFQAAELQVRKAGQRLARLLPERAAGLIARLGDGVHVAHVGPAAFPSWQARAGRYHWMGQVDTARFQSLLAAADLMLSFNATGTTTMAAVSAGVPVVAGINSHRLRSVDEAAAALGRDPEPELREWLARVAPLFPFHVWGLGLFDFLEPVLRGNPYLDTFRRVEILDGEGFVETCRALLFDEAERARMQRRQSEYCTAVRALPGPAAAFDQALSSTESVSSLRMSKSSAATSASRPSRKARSCTASGAKPAATAAWRSSSRS
jgi:hypothetical protein